MRKLYKNFHIFHFKKRIVSTETIRGNTVHGIWTLKKLYLSILFCRFLAVLEFIIGTKQQSEEMGTSWITEAMEEMRFALQCYGSSKVIMILILYIVESVRLLKFYFGLSKVVKCLAKIEHTLKLKPFGVLPTIKIVMEVRRLFTGMTMSIDAKMSNVLSLKIVKCKKHKTRSTLKVETQ